MNGERIAFENWLGIKPCGAAHDLAWAAWQARASLPTQPAQAAQVPEGFALVPVVPTISMLMAGDKSRLSMEHPSRSSAVWSAMLTAAQQGGDHAG